MIASIGLAAALKTWVLVAFGMWLLLLAAFRRVGIQGRVLIATTSWLAARVSLPAVRIVIRWLVAHFSI